MIILYFFSVLFLVIGIAVVIAGIKEITDYKVKTTGTVVDYVVGGPNTLHSASVHGGNYSSGTSKFPVIEFNNGERAVPKYGSTDIKFRIGDRLIIYYNPEDHSKIRIKGVSLYIVIGSVFSAIGVIMTVISIAVTVMLL